MVTVARLRRFIAAENVTGPLLVAPVVLWLAATIGIPLADSLYVSLEDVRVVGGSAHFVGLANYRSVLSSASTWQALGNSIVWVGGNAVAQTLFALITALIINERFRGVRLVRSVVVIPWVVPTIVVVIIWRWLLSTSGGLVNFLLIAMDVVHRPVGFFSSGPSAMIALILINSWRWFPFMAILLLANLQGIPRDLYEAAGLDGASAFARFWHITLPMLQPAMAVLGVMGTVLSFNVFDVIYLISGGGPANATTTLPVLIYRTAFYSYGYSRAAALSIATGLVVMVFALVFMRNLTPRLATPEA
jgi:multiple sugar transport system permease protein